MKNHDVLYLGSQSRARQKLLTEAAIPFIVLTHTSDEEAVKRNPDFKLYVQEIAKSKMEALDLPTLQNQQPAHTNPAHPACLAEATPERRREKPARGECSRSECIEPCGLSNRIFVFTADTLIRTVSNDEILAKPVNLEHAKEMLQRISAGPIDVQTGCCLRVYRATQTGWQSEKETLWTSGALCEFIQDADEFDGYVKHIPFILSTSGGCVAEGYGENFFKSINGSLSAVYGVPVFELRQELKKLGFIFPGN